MSAIEITSDSEDNITTDTQNCVASTSNGSISMYLKSHDETDEKISESTIIFNELIKKCYQNEKFPKSNIEVIEKLFRSLPSDYINTEDFVLLLKEANRTIWPDSNLMVYVSHIEHIYDQLQKFKTSMKAQERNISEDNRESNKKKFKKLKSLKIALKATRKRIKELDESEMDINNEDEFDVNSPYILKDRYEKRLLEIYKKICKISEEPDFLEDPSLHFNGTNNKLVNKTIEKFYNSNKTFPDYYEVYTLLKTLQEKKNLKWTEDELKHISHDAFIKLGKQLKLRRLKEYFDHLSNMITEPDPAEDNLVLKKKLDDSSKKLHADLNRVTEKYINIQDDAEETEGSDLNNTECENSSDDDCCNKKLELNKTYENTNSIPIKRKRVESDELEKVELPKKSQKTIYMESFNLMPCSVALEPLENMLTDQVDIQVITGKVFENKAIIENVNEIVNNTETSGDSEKVTNDTSKIVLENSITIPTKNAEKVTDQSLNIAPKSSQNNHVNLESYKSDGDESLADDGILVIDEGISVDNVTDETIPKELHNNEAQKVGSDLQRMNNNILPIDREDIDSFITEPEVILREGNNLDNDLIEINELDDSDVEITSCEIPKVPVQNKKTLESIIKSLDFNKKYAWDQSQRPSNSDPYCNLPNRHSVNSNQNLNSNCVNRWIINNARPPRINSHSVRSSFTNRQSSLNHRMPSTMHRSSTKRQVTQRILNSVQQQHSFVNNQRVMTMTTTTTVQQVVQQSAESGGRRLNSSINQNRRLASFQSNTDGPPELIELD